MRKGKLQALADQFISSLCNAVEAVVIQFLPKPAGPAAAGSSDQAVQPVRWVPLPDCIQANREPYLQSDWRQEPYAPRCVSVPPLRWSLTPHPKTLYIIGGP
jgi:hypothetical protein